MHRSHSTMVFGEGASTPVEKSEESAVGEGPDPQVNSAGDWVW